MEVPYHRRDVASWGKALSLSWIILVSGILKSVYPEECGLCSLHNIDVATLLEHLSAIYWHTCIILAPWDSEVGGSSYQGIPMITIPREFEISLGKLWDHISNFKVREGQRDSPMVEYFPSKTLGSKSWALTTAKFTLEHNAGMKACHYLRSHTNASQTYPH